ncbi:MAG: extracellular solute-binding protein [Anaerolineae bacterium]
MEKQTLTRRQLIALTGGLGCAAALAACAPQEKVVQVEKEVTQVVKETVVATPAPQSVEISLLMVDWNDVSRKAIEEVIIPRFEETHPGTTVAIDFTAPDWSELDTKVLTAAAGGLTPDVIQADLIEFGSKYYLKGLIAELNPWLDAAPGSREKLADYYEKGIYEGCSWEGKLLALPYLMDNRALFFRKDFLQEAGFDPAKGFADWEEFRAAAKAMTVRDGDIYQRMGWYNPAGQFCFQTYVQFLWQNGGALVNEAGDAPAFNTPEGVGALEFWTRLIREDKVAPVEGMEKQGDMDLMAAGMLASKFAGPGLLFDVQNYAPDKWDLLGVTILGNKKKAGLWYVNCYLLSSGPRQKPAWDLLSYLVFDDEAFKAYLEAQATLPPRRSMVKACKHITPLHMVLIEDLMNAENSHTSPLLRFAVMEIYERIDEACQKAVYGTATPAEALAQAEQECIQIFDRHLKGQ